MIFYVRIFSELTRVDVNQLQQIKNKELKPKEKLQTEPGTIVIISGVLGLTTAFL